MVLLESPSLLIFITCAIFSFSIDNQISIKQKANTLLFTIQKFSSIFRNVYISEIIPLSVHLPLNTCRLRPFPTSSCVSNYCHSEKYSCISATIHATIHACLAIIHPPGRHYSTRRQQLNVDYGNINEARPKLS